MFSIVSPTPKSLILYFLIFPLLFAGTLQADPWGKDADLALFDKHPLSNFAKVQKVLIDGEIYFDRDADLAARPERESTKKTLKDRQKQQQKQSTGRRPS